MAKQYITFENGTDTIEFCYTSNESINVNIQQYGEDVEYSLNITEIFELLGWLLKQLSTGNLSG